MFYLYRNTSSVNSIRNLSTWFALRECEKAWNIGFHHVALFPSENDLVDWRRPTSRRHPWKSTAQCGWPVKRVGKRKSVLSCAACEDEHPSPPSSTQFHTTPHNPTPHHAAPFRATPRHATPRQAEPPHRAAPRRAAVLMKISDNWPENEHLWWIKRGALETETAHGPALLAFLRCHKTGSRSVICNEYGSN